MHAYDTYLSHATAHNVTHCIGGCNVSNKILFLVKRTCMESYASLLFSVKVSLALHYNLSVAVTESISKKRPGSISS